jgi:uncharacterized damage-inducible protein DinB
MQHVKRLLDHLGWADALALEALRAAVPTDLEAFEIYRHVLGAEHVWLARLKGEPATVAVWPQLTLSECEPLARANLASLRAYVTSLAPADLSRGVTYRNSAGDQFNSAVEDILLHVCLHGAYHRGQVALALRRAGSRPNPTDYIAFVRGAPAATRADAESRRKA